MNFSTLITLPSHRACNEAYRLDEEYFTWALAPLRKTLAANALSEYNASKVAAGHNVKLHLKVLKEFERRPSGLFLPAGVILKRLEGHRIKRVAWKIVRGLYYHETGTPLPEDTVFSLDFVAPHHSLPEDLTEVWEAVRAQASKGAYPGVFDYKYLHLQADGEHLHGWGLLLWDGIVMFLAHWHPDPPADAA